MNWLARLVPPRIKALVKQDVPDNLWEKCPVCGEMIFHRELYSDKYVCRYCQHHFFFPVAERIKDLYDEGFKLLAIPEVKTDPINFKDSKKYVDRLKESKINAGTGEAVVSIDGTVEGIKVISSIFNFKFIGGSMGTCVGESIVQAVELAITNGCPYVVFTASGGARMQEGMLSLMQMPKTVAAISRLKNKKIPYLVVLTNPTMGGVSASFAMIGDVHIAEPGAIIGFAGSRVIRDTIHQELPNNFQTSEYLLEHGMIDFIVPRKQIRETIVKLCKLLQSKN